MARNQRRPTRRGHAFRSCLQWALWIAACAGLRAQHLQVASFGTAAGLANLNATTILQDRTGSVWIGTESGVYLADGQRFLKRTAFSDAGIETIDALREDAQGRIWALDQRHLVVWDGTAARPIAGLALRKVTGEVRDLLPSGDGRGAMFLLAGGELTRIASSDGGGSWTGTPAIRASLLAAHPELRRLTALAPGAGPLLWAGCGTMLCLLNPGTGTLQTFGQAEGVPADVWGAVLRTRDGAVWARGTKAIVRLPAGSSQFKPVSGLPANIGLAVLRPSIVEDPEGRIVLNVGEGILRTVSGDGQEGWRAFDHTHGLPEAELQTLFFDRAGELWMAPEGLGIARSTGYLDWEGWSKTEGLRSNVVWSSVEAANRDFWAITPEGLDKLDRAGHRFVHAESSIPLPKLRVAAPDARGHLWLGDAAGRVLDYDPATLQTRVAAAGLGRVTQLRRDRQDRLWVCSAAGLRLFTANDGWKAPQSPGADTLPAGYAWSLAEGPSGTLWLSNGQGLFRLDGERWTPIALPFPGGKAYNFMVAAALDGTLWVQSKQPFPLLRLRVAGDRAEIVERVAGATFGSDNLTFLHIDRRGWLWVGSDDGVHVYDGTRWVQVNSEDGLIWDDTDFQAFSEDRDGSVWIGTSLGLSHLLRPERLFAVPDPSVRVLEARIGETLLSGGNPRLDLRRPTLMVSLMNPNYERGDAVVFRYRLEGQENVWQETTDGRLRFPALDAGRYRLTVVAVDKRLHRSSEPVALAFTVLDPWWRRAWFLWIEAGCALLAGFAVWRFSVHLLVKRQQALERLVASRTRELEREKAELLSARSALLELTRRDALTGLLNRGAIFAHMSSLCEESLVSGRPLALAMADLDSFKGINDRYGHVMGDAVLRECARRVEGVMRSNDAVGRYGGEELLILMPGLHPASAPARMEQLRLAIAEAPIVHGDMSLTVTCSFGVAWLSGRSCSLESLVGLADAALYRAKQNGRNRVEFAFSDVGPEPPSTRNAVDSAVCQ